MESESHLRRGSPQKASWRPLGALLEALGAEKNKVGIALGRSWKPSKTDFSKKGSKMGPQKISRSQHFPVPSWGPKLDPPFHNFRRGFRGFPRACLTFSKSIFRLPNLYTSILQIKVLSSSFLSGIPPPGLNNQA